MNNTKSFKKTLNSLQIRTKYPLILNVKLSDQKLFLQGNERAVYWLTYTLPKLYFPNNDRNCIKSAMYFKRFEIPCTPLLNIQKPRLLILAAWN